MSCEREYQLNWKWFHYQGFHYKYQSQDSGPLLCGDLVQKAHKILHSALEIQVGLSSILQDATAVRNTSSLNYAYCVGKRRQYLIYFTTALIPDLFSVMSLMLQARLYGTKSALPHQRLE